MKLQKPSNFDNTKQNKKQIFAKPESEQAKMKKTDSKVQKYLNLQGYLEKQGDGPFVGFQVKHWKVTDDGTRIGYSNSKEESIKDDKNFFIKDCLASQSSGKAMFELWTGRKRFFLKAATEEEMADWVYGLSFLKKIISKQIKFKPQLSPTQTTLASYKQRCKTKKKQKIQQLSPTQEQRPRYYQPEDLSVGRPAAQQTQSTLILELAKQMGKNYLKYNTIITHLRVKTQGIIMSSFDSHVYVLVSPKSLYPDIHTQEINLANPSLPHWLEVNYFYRITDGKEKKKEIFHVKKILEVQEGSEECSLKINTGQVIHEFFTESIQQKECLKRCLQIAVINAQEVDINGRISKRNFDRLIDLHQKDFSCFEKEAKSLAQSFNKSEQCGHLPLVLCEFVTHSMAYLIEFIEVLDNKKSNKNHVVSDVLKQFHESVKIQMKMTWDCCRETIKLEDILKILKKLSQYYDLMKNHIKSPQFYDGMKELSKIYVRQTYRNFESTIIKLVERQKSESCFCEDEDYLQTFGVADLFTFIYKVFAIAYPNWINKNHLHNVSKFMIKVLQVYTNEIKLAIYEEDISDKSMIAIANNYFRFEEFVSQFYDEKLDKHLAMSTRDDYDNLKERYHQISMAVVHKISSNIGCILEQCCSKCTLQTLRCEYIQQILQKETASVEKYLHRAFTKKFEESVMKEVHLKVCGLVARISKQKTKKQLKIKQIVGCVQQVKEKLSGVWQQSKYFAKKMQEIVVILNIDLYEDISDIIKRSSQPVRQVYRAILQLRQDYVPNSAFYRIVNNDTIKLSKELNNRNSKSVDSLIRAKNVTLSRQYYHEEMYGNDENSLEDDKSKDSQKPRSRFGGDGSWDRLISEGYLVKGKPNQKVWQKRFFRLKNEYLYVFQDADSDKSSYQIEVKRISQISIPNSLKPSFIVCYKTLVKQKQVKLKADSIEVRDRWVNSIELERKRLNNEQKVKKKTSIKYQEDESAKKKQMIIDYWELERGKDYFSYSTN